MSNYSIRDISRFEASLIDEINFVINQLRTTLNNKVGTRDQATDGAKAAIEDAAERLLRLRTAKFSIRLSKQNFNETNGINERTIKIAQLMEEKDFLENIVVSNGTVSESANFRSGNTEYSMGLDTLVFDDYRVKVKKITRQITQLKDSCAGINNAGKVELPPYTVEILIKFGIID